MALRQSKRVAARMPATESDGAGELVCQVGEYVIPAGGVALNDVIEMVVLPAHHILLDVMVYLDDLDSATSMSLDYGLLSGRAGDGTDNARTCGNTIGAADTTARTGGIFRMNKVSTSFASGASDVGVGIKVAAAAGTPVVGAKVRMAIFYTAEPGLTT